MDQGGEFGQHPERHLEVALGQLLHVDAQSEAQSVRVRAGPCVGPHPARVLNRPVPGRALFPVENPAFRGFGDVGAEPADELGIGLVGERCEAEQNGRRRDPGLLAQRVVFSKLYAGGSRYRRGSGS